MAWLMEKNSNYDAQLEQGNIKYGINHWESNDGLMNTQNALTDNNYN
jgi:hypothetical protein